MVELLMCLSNGAFRRLYCTVRLLTRTISFQQSPLEAPSHQLHAPSPALLTVGGMGSNS